MVFRYTYRTSDGAWHESEIKASEKSAVYDLLKARNIKPVKVWCPNPPLFAFSKRWLAIVLLAVSLAASLAFLALRTNTHAQPGNGAPAADSLPRHRIMSAPPDFAARVNEIFAFSSERFLALHAQPGLLFDAASAIGELADLEEALSREITIAENDPAWVAELKKTVTGMKSEAELLLKNGKKTSDVALWLKERQKMEATYRNQIMSAPGTLEEKARRLRAMGL